MTTLTTGDSLGIIAFLFSSAGLVYAAINHKRIRCKCCGKDVDMSVDIDTTEPVVSAESVEDKPIIFKLTPPRGSIPVAKPNQVTPSEPEPQLPPLRIKNPKRPPPPSPPPPVMQIIAE